MREKARIFYGKSGVRRLYNEIAENYDKSKELYITRLMENSEKPIIENFLSTEHSEYSADLGCGTCRYLKNLLAISKYVVAVDFSINMVKVAMKKHRKFKDKVDFVVADMEYLPFRKFCLNLVLSTLVINHLKNIEGALSEVRRVLKIKGVFIFSTLNKIVIDKYNRKHGIPQDTVLFVTENISPTYVYEKGTLESEIREMLKKHKFKIIEFKPVAYWVLLGFLPKHDVLLHVFQSYIQHLDLLGKIIPPKYAFIHVFKAIKIG